MRRAFLEDYIKQVIYISAFIMLFFMVIPLFAVSNVQSNCGTFRLKIDIATDNPLDYNKYCCKVNASNNWLTGKLIEENTPEKKIKLIPSIYNQNPELYYSSLNSFSLSSGVITQLRTDNAENLNKEAVVTLVPGIDFIVTLKGKTITVQPSEATKLSYIISPLSITVDALGSSNLEFTGSADYDPFTIAVMSDIHIGYDGKNNDGNESRTDFINALTKIEKWNKTHEKNKVVAVIINGDITNTGKSAQFNSFVFLAVSKLNIPVYAGYGNHDNGSKGDGYSNIASEIIDFSFYNVNNVNGDIHHLKSDGGEHEYFWRIHNWLFAQLNYCPKKAETAIKTLKYDLLKETPNAHVVVNMHDAEDSDNKYGKDVISECKQNGWWRFGGHTHQPNLDKTSKFLTTGAVGWHENNFHNDIYFVTFYPDGTMDFEQVNL